MSVNPTTSKRSTWLCLFNQVPTGLILLLLFLALYTLTMSGRIQYGDEVEKYRVAQSIVDRHEFSFRPTAQRNEAGVGGRTYSIYEMGQTVLEIPFYSVGRFLNTWTGLPDVNQLGQLFVGLLNPVLTALTVVVLYETCLLLGWTTTVGTGLSLVYGLATIAWPYSKGFTREPSLALFLLLSVYGVLRFQKRGQFAWLIVAGTTVGYLVFTKFIHGIVLPLFLVYVLLIVFYDHRKNARRAIRPLLKTALIFLLPTLLALAFQTVYSIARFGTFAAGLGGSRTDPISWILLLLNDMRPADAIPGLLVSPEKSVFLYSLPTLLFPIAWVKWFHVSRREALLFLGLVGVEIATVLFRPDWHGGTWWGPRYMVQVTPLLILPLGVLLGASDVNRSWTRILAALSVLGFAVQLVGVSANTRDYMDATGAGITVAGQFDFLLHGALDSLYVYTTSGWLPHVNPFGVLLLALIVYLGFWLARRMGQANSDHSCSIRAGLASGALMLAVLGSGLVAWVALPYSSVLTAMGNVDFESAERFLAGGRAREATAFYFSALDLGTSYQDSAVQHVASLASRGTGLSITTDDLFAHAETTGEGSVTLDYDITLSGTALRTSVPPPLDANARGVSAPIPVRPNTAYQLSGWLKAESVYGTGAGALSIYEDNGNWENRRNSDVGFLDETTGWRLLRTTFTTLPTTRRLYVAAGLWNTYGTLWVDRIELIELAP